MEWIKSRNPLDYKIAIAKMEGIVDKIISGDEQETIWLLEHNEIYTAGTSTKNIHLENVRSAPIIKTNRGGQLTFHGPGQRIIYLMVKLERFSYDIRKYVSFLEQLIMNTLYEFNISTHRWDKAIGVWTYKQKNSRKIVKKDRHKIASIGIRVRKKISFHGISVNINPNLDFFDKIILCGLENTKATSAKELGVKISYNDFDEALKINFEKLLKNYTKI